MEDIIDADYVHVKIIRKDFEMKHLEELCSKRYIIVS